MGNGVVLPVPNLPAYLLRQPDADWSIDVAGSRMGAIGGVPVSNQRLTIYAADPVRAIAIPATTAGKGPVVIDFGDVVFAGTPDPVTVFGYNFDIHGSRIVAGEAAVGWYVEGDYNDGARRYTEAYISVAPNSGSNYRPFAYTGDRADRNFVNLDLTVGTVTGCRLAVIKSSDGSNLFTFRGDGSFYSWGPMVFQAANPYIQAALNTPLALIANGKYVWVSNTLTDGLQFGSAKDTNLYRSAANTLRTDSVFMPMQAVTASAPAYVKGGIYFDTTLNKLRIGGATAWETVTSV